MCCTGDSPAVNAAKNMAIPVLIFGILTLLGLFLPPHAGGAGGLLAVIGSSIILCCGRPAGGGLIACAILNLLAAIFHIVGVVTWLVWFFSVTSYRDCLKDACDKKGYTDWDGDTDVSTWWMSDKNDPILEKGTCDIDAQQNCSWARSHSEIATGFVGIILWPAIVLAGVSAGLELALVVLAFKASKGGGGSGGVKPPPVSI